MAGVADGLARRRLVAPAIAALMLLGWAPAGARAAWLSPVDLSAAGGDASQPQVAVDAAGDAASYARPRGATPTVVSLVPAFAPCAPAAANRTHGAPPGYPSCAPPVQASSFLTVGTPDSNGAPANAVGSIRYKVQTNPSADVLIDVSTTDVRCKPAESACGSANGASGADYTGQLQATASVRMTDKQNGSSGSEPATVEDFPMPFNLPCVATTSTTTGGNCSLATSANAVRPASVQSGKRAIWGLGQVQVFDGGASGTAGATDATLFEDQGLFVP